MEKGEKLLRYKLREQNTQRNLRRLRSSDHEVPERRYTDTLLFFTVFSHSDRRFQLLKFVGLLCFSGDQLVGKDELL
ncbi:unnamed protein product [Citrullus colocynthis]|uniref:Uncharacterized protein n=1 Tax=Citrullus colocynthis TaxID=252529 RepID=A0ABP0YP87_9ROSI